ncbi:RNA-binding transcriptional accessory protein [Corynebacterium sp. sy017]|uniref:Tex family protein n=1 Tax=unclassified Corynebacterium TaxID=2624378 RepID=UPI0011852155|nr:MULTISPECIES: Tex family protein [unclassified Corynebacterium]MBP3087868.1 RNA-binding transcriptional accessory protein [Corynebacterium sp. sy017]TSD92409.1 RNA-binding transcriptional accessory protein [Corynebacterium sp. SY003]
MIAHTIATELNTEHAHVAAALKLLAQGNTVPFIARYRKEATGGLDDSQLRHIEQRASYLQELAQRKETILAAIEQQGKLSDQLRQLIEQCDTKARLEDLYLPYKKRRKTKADSAREAGLENLLDELIAQPHLNPEEYAQRFICSGFADVKAVLDGARAILSDRLAVDADLVGDIREHMYQHGQLRAEVIEGKEQEGEKYKDYFQFSQSFAELPSHRILALLRGEKEEVLHLSFIASDNEHDDQHYVEKLIAHTGYDDVSPWLRSALLWSWKTKLYISASLDVRMRLKEKAEQEALLVFARNLKDVLLAAPAGQRTTLGLDPGYRNGVKCAVVDKTGKVLDTLIVYPHQPRNQWAHAREELAHICAQYAVELIAVGNGTASRETKKLAEETATLIKQAGGMAPIAVTVSESGASVYSASELAAQEFPTMDVSLRGAVSIARRLQDPLAELVKIDPKAIGVGQYQHDVNQAALARTLDAVVEDAVNAVGVDLNTASAPLLARVAGISSSIAENIVAYRDEYGAFSSRATLTKVPRLGAKAYEQCAGFLRINGAQNPLDASAVHPEAYPIVSKIAGSAGLGVGELIGNSAVLRSLKPASFADENFGVPTISDIFSELEKPGRDPRPEFETARFKDGVEKISDLRPGMILEGTVTNVAAFGAFVDVGVHQDGLVHISALANRFVSDPHEIVSSGQVVTVKVVEVEPERNRISLSMRLDENSEEKAVPTRRSPKKKAQKGTAVRRGATRQNSQGLGAMAQALRSAGF